MDAKIKTTKCNPAKYDSEGNIATPANAVITLEVPIDIESQKVEVVSLLDTLDKEWVTATITQKQTVIKGLTEAQELAS